MSDCERHEILISGWIDAEIDRDDQAELLDHLVRCAPCRGLYRDARALTGVLAAARARSAPDDLHRAGRAREIWERIERSALSEETGRSRGPGRGWSRRLPQGAMAAAAAVLLFVLGAFVARSWMPGPTPAGATIRIGADAGRMNDARFVALTAEVLRADRKYRAAFYEVMKQVVEDTGSDEASPEIRRPEGEGLEESEAPESRRSRT